jgi:DNA-binding response OmpR family regulator
MKQHPALGRRVRVIMVTALDEWDDKRQALQTGADDYVTKPFDLPKLAATVERNAALLAATG